MFWMLSRNIDRLRAEEDVRNLQVASRCPCGWRGREGVHGGFATQDWKTSRNR